MDKQINLEEFLAFDDVDSIAPDKVVIETCDTIKEQTRCYVQGVVKEYDGPIASSSSYTTKGISSAAIAALQAFGGEKKVNIQNDLGAIGYEEHRFEFYLTATALPKYKFRLMFFSYGIGGYPVRLVLEQSIADEIFERTDGKYIVSCNSKDDLENTIIRVISTKRVIQVIQELINASVFAKSHEIEAHLSTDGADENEDEQ